MPAGIEAALTPAARSAQTKLAGQSVTFNCMVPGDGPRAIDRDVDGVANNVDEYPDDAACE